MRTAPTNPALVKDKIVSFRLTASEERLFIRLTNHLATKECKRANQSKTILRAILLLAHAEGLNLEC